MCSAAAVQAALVAALVRRVLLLGVQWGGRSGGRGERFESSERVGERLCPGPGVVDAQRLCACVKCEARGNVQQAVEQALGFCALKLTGQQALGPDD